MKHKHSEVIKEFADGKICEYWSNELKKWGHITQLDTFDWAKVVRVKPEPKEDIEETVLASYGVDGLVIFNRAIPRNLKLTFDGETGQLKSAEVIK
jgi:hypothetical protein